MKFLFLHNNYNLHKGNKYFIGWLKIHLGWLNSTLLILDIVHIFLVTLIQTYPRYFANMKIIISKFTFKYFSTLKHTQISKLLKNRPDLFCWCFFCCCLADCIISYWSQKCVLCEVNLSYDSVYLSFCLVMYIFLSFSNRAG